MIVVSENFLDNVLSWQDLICVYVCVWLINLGMLVEDSGHDHDKDLIFVLLTPVCQLIRRF